MTFLSLVESWDRGTKRGTTWTLKMMESVSTSTNPRGSKAFQGLESGGVRPGAYNVLYRRNRDEESFLDLPEQTFPDSSTVSTTTSNNNTNDNNNNNNNNNHEAVSSNQNNDDNNYYYYNHNNYYVITVAVEEPTRRQNDQLLVEGVAMNEKMPLK
jgi:hypothetical protein